MHSALAALYPLLARGTQAPRELWSRQADVLRAYDGLKHDKEQFPPDVAIELPTDPGQGRAGDRPARGDLRRPAGPAALPPPGPGLPPRAAAAGRRAAAAAALRTRCDRALLTGYAAALRRSELVALDVGDLTENDAGLFLRFAAREEWLSGSLGLAIDVPKLPVRLPKPLDDDARDLLLDALPAETLEQKRDRAFVLFLLSTGARIAEALRLDRCNWQPDRMTVIGKGDRERTVVITEKARQAMEQYLEARTDPSPALFIGFQPAKETRPATGSPCKAPTTSATSSRRALAYRSSTPAGCVTPSGPSCNKRWVTPASPPRRSGTAGWRR